MKDMGARDAFGKGRAGSGDRMRSIGQAIVALALAVVAPAVAQDGPGWDGATWRVEDIRGRGVIDNAETSLRVAPDGDVSGSTGCNVFHGHATIEGAKISFGQMASTMRACAPALMDQEQKFLKALAATRRARFDDKGRLRLCDAKGKPLLTLTKK